MKARATLRDAHVGRKSGNDSAGSPAAALTDATSKTDDDWPDDAPLRVLHPREALPRRPGRIPGWQPTRDRRDAGNRPLARSLLDGWRNPRIAAAPDLGQRRINFTYRNAFTTVAGFGEKPKRAQYFESPYETALWRVLEMSTKVIDYQFQPVTATWDTNSPTGRASYTVDVLYLLEDGTLVSEEVKASDAYFADLQTADTLGCFEQLMTAKGVSFERRAGGELADDVMSRTVKNAFDDRRTAFSESEAERAAEVVRRHEGGAPLGLVLEAIGRRSFESQAALNAMMMHRLLRVDMSRPPMRDTIVSIPPEPVAPGALRSFLAEHLQEID